MGAPEQCPKTNINRERVCFFPQVMNIEFGFEI
jgi:hypothetical protein